MQCSEDTRHDMTWHDSTAWALHGHGRTWHDMIWHGMIAWRGIALHGPALRMRAIMREDQPGDGMYVMCACM